MSDLDMMTVKGELPAYVMVRSVHDPLKRTRYVRERKCQVVSTIQHESYIEGQTVFEYEHELSCGHIATSGYKAPPNYCFECGARVVE